MKSIQDIENKIYNTERTEVKNEFNISEEFAYKLLIGLAATIEYITYCKVINAYGNIKYMEFIRENANKINLQEQKVIRISLINIITKQLPTLQNKSIWKDLLEIVNNDIIELTTLIDISIENINKERENNVIKKLVADVGSIRQVIDNEVVLLQEYDFITRLLHGYTNIYYIIDNKPILAIIITKCISTGNTVNTEDVLLNMHTIELPSAGRYIQKEKISAKYLYKLFTNGENKHITGIVMSKPI